MTDAVEVKIGAQTDDAKQSVEGLAASLDASFKRMADSLQKFTEQSKRAETDIVKHNETIGQAFVKLKDQAQGSFDKITGSIERFRNLMLAVSGIVAGGALWKEVIDSTTHLQHEVSELQRVMGLTSSEATTLAIQLKLAGSNADSFSTIALHMGRMLKTNSEEFTRLGVTIKDSNGNLLPMQQIMRNVNDRMAEFKLGTDQNMVALTLAGRSALEFAETMEKLERVEGRAVEMQKQLGIEMGPERQEQIKAYKIEVNALGVVWDSIATRIGEKVLPKLQGFAGWVNEYGPAIADVFVFMARSILSAFQIIGTAVGGYLTVFATIFRTLSVDIAEDIIRINKGLLSLKLSEVAAGYKNIWDKMKGETGAGVDSIIAQWEGMQKKLAALWSDGKLPSTKAGGGPRGGSQTYTPPPGGGGDTSQVPGFETELKRQRDAYERMKLEQGSFEQWSIQATADYWKKILDLGGLSDKDRLSVLDRYYDAEREARLKAFAGEIAALDASAAKFKYNFAERIRIAQEAYAKIAAAFGPSDPRTQAAQRKLTEEENGYAEQRLRIADIEQRKDIETAKNRIDMARLANEQDVAMRKISAEQGLALQRDYLSQETAVVREEVQKRIDIMAADPNSDPVKLAELKAQLLTIEQNYQKQLTQLSNSEALERNKYAIEGAQRLQDALASSLSTIGDRTKSLGDKFRALGATIEQIITDLVAKKLAASLVGPGTGGGDLLGSALGWLLGGAGGGAAKSAGPGWTNGFDLPALAVGTNYVPQDMLAMIHKGEAVVPAAYNNSSSNSKSTVVHQAVHLHISGQVDTRSRSQIELGIARGFSRTAYRDG